MILRQVNPNYVCQLWPQVSSMLEKALEYAGGEYTIEQLKGMLAMGDKTLLVAEEGEIIKGAAVVSLIRYPNEFVCFIMAVGGRLISSPDIFDQLSEWAKGQGCTLIRGAARESVERLWRQKFEFVERYRIVEKRI